MVVQVLLDSLSRCFGAPVPMHTPGRSNVNIDGSVDHKPTTRDRQRNKSGEVVLDARRRQGRALGLELHDKEWDALFNKERGNKSEQTRFENDNDGDRQSISKRVSKIKSKQSPHKSTRKSSASPHRVPDREIAYSEVLAKVREAAKPSKHVTPRKSKHKSDIFRSRKAPNTSLASKILGGKDGVVKVLCFANPVHEKTYDKGDARMIGNSNTLDTADESETVNSTMYYEKKYSGAMATRPAMPLFQQYKVKSSYQDENVIMGIVTSGSHKSIHMVQLHEQDGSMRRLFQPADGQPDKYDDDQIDLDVDIELSDNEGTDCDEDMYAERNSNKNISMDEGEQRPGKSNKSSASHELRDSNSNSRQMSSTRKIISAAGYHTKEDSIPPPVQIVSGSLSSHLSRSKSPQRDHMQKNNSQAIQFVVI